MKLKHDITIMTLNTWHHIHDIKNKDRTLLLFDSTISSTLRQQCSKWEV